MDNSYFIFSAKKYFDHFWEKRLKFINRKKYIYSLISKTINNSISKNDRILLLSAGNFLIKDDIHCEKIDIHEVNENFHKVSNQRENYIQFNSLKDINLKNYDHIIIADLEYQSNVNNNLNYISKQMRNDARLIVVSKSIIWFLLIGLVKKIFFIQSPSTYNFIPFYFLLNMFEINNFNILKNDKVIFFPYKLPIISKIINSLFKLPLLKFFCAVNLTVLKKNYEQNDNKLLDYKISVIIPCKNEEGNILKIKNEMINLANKTEYLFGDDKSTDATKKMIDSLKSDDPTIEIKSYEGPGICKSMNVYKGIEESSGDIIVIYDADLTVKMKEIKTILDNYLNPSNDFINCTRMIYPQENNAMKQSNYFGNKVFAFLFSVLLQQRVTDTLCGTKIFYKKDWVKIKQNNSKWGIKDLWGDFDLLLGAYKSNLKIIDVPVNYYERVEGSTKMTSVIKNGLRMLFIILFSYYKLRMKQ